MPSIKKIKIMASPNVPKEDVKDMLHNSLHMMHRFEDEMHDHPFGGKLINIGKPMMMGGLHDVMDLLGGNTLPHLMHHLDHHPEFGGCHHHPHHEEEHHHGCCQDFIGKLCKCIVLFLIWKIFESIDCRCKGFSEAQVLKKFKHDLTEQYGKIHRINSLLNESTLALNEDHIAGMKVKSLMMIDESFDPWIEGLWDRISNFDLLNYGGGQNGQMLPANPQLGQPAPQRTGRFAPTATGFMQDAGVSQGTIDNLRAAGAGLKGMWANAKAGFKGIPDDLDAVSRSMYYSIYPYAQKAGTMLGNAGEAVKRGLGAAKTWVGNNAYKALPAELRYNTIQTEKGPDGKMHTYGVDKGGNKIELDPTTWAVGDQNKSAVRRLAGAGLARAGQAARSAGSWLRQQAQTAPRSLSVNTGIQTSENTRRKSKKKKFV